MGDRAEPSRSMKQGEGAGGSRKAYILRLIIQYDLMELSDLIELRACDLEYALNNIRFGASVTFNDSIHEFDTALDCFIAGIYDAADIFCRTSIDCNAYICYLQ